MRVLMDGFEIRSAEDGTRVELRRSLTARAGEDEPADVAQPAASDARLAFSRQREVTVARLEGEVDLQGVAALGSSLARAARDGDRGLVLDLNGVEYLDSAGLHLLHDAARTLADRGQSLRVVVAPDATVMRLLELVHLEQTVPLDATVTTAVDALAPRPPL
jgi:anti-anti-sigma factor